MCGRAACGLAPDELCRRCHHRNENGKWVEPQWKDVSGKDQKYFPSYNICPGSLIPVLVSRRSFSRDSQEKPSNDSPEKVDSEIKSETIKTESIKKEFIKSESIKDEFDEVSKDSDLVMCVMRWGLVPSWHSGSDVKSFSYNMNNARSEGMLTTRSFKTPLLKGRRCVVVVEGYYEWREIKDAKKKQPYFIYFPPQSEDTKFRPPTDDTKCNISEDKSCKLEESKPEDSKSDGRLLTLAGIFDIWTSKETGEKLYSVSVVTVDAHQSIQFIHDRMPAILNGEDEVNAWLNFSEVPLIEAVKLIYPKDCLRYHEVSSVAVGNVRNKTNDCVQPLNMATEGKKKSSESDFMKSWLSKGVKRENEEEKSDVKVKMKKE